MFEKEAEEYLYDRLDPQAIDSVSEFSNKHIEEAIVSSFKDGAEFGYNKANEWHYPSKGEFPKCDEETQLVFYVNCYYEIGGETITRKRIVLGYYKKAFLREDVKLFVEKSRGYEDEHLPQDVIAWKEIVLPETKESE